MIVVVQGSNSFDDYSIFLRAMGVAMSSMPANDNELIVYSAGPVNINNYTAEFCNLTERSMKSRGKKIKYYKAPQEWVSENIGFINYFAYMCKPNEHPSKLVATAQLNNVEVGIFRY